MKNFSIFKLIQTSLLGTWVCVSFVYGNTGNGVGNGGDIVSSYLEASRYTLVKTIQMLKINTSAQNSLCQNLDYLSPAQKNECQGFLIQTIDKMLQLNTSLPITPFIIRSEPLLVLGPDGQKRPVDAMTQLGPKGPIEFNFFNVRYYTPSQLLQLISHEFGHKMEYQGINIDDNSPTLAFSKGRELLDAVAEALVLTAKKYNFVKDGYFIKDHFICTVDVGPPHYILIPKEASSVRRFLDSLNFDQYDVSVGKLISDAEVCIEERYQKNKISFQIEIHEEAGCRPVADMNQRWTKIELVRFSKDNLIERSGQRPGPEILASEIYPNFNPICQEPNNRESIGLNYGEVRFECQYSGSAVGSLSFTQQ
jgi:hypothetical protein